MHENYWKNTPILGWSPLKIWKRYQSEWSYSSSCVCYGWVLCWPPWSVLDTTGLLETYTFIIIFDRGTKLKLSLCWKFSFDWNSLKCFAFDVANLNHKLNLGFPVRASTSGLCLPGDPSNPFAWRSSNTGYLVELPLDLLPQFPR